MKRKCRRWKARKKRKHTRTQNPSFYGGDVKCMLVAHCQTLVCHIKAEHETRVSRTFRKAVQSTKKKGHKENENSPVKWVSLDKFQKQRWEQAHTQPLHHHHRQQQLSSGKNSAILRHSQIEKYKSDYGLAVKKFDWQEKRASKLSSNE